jgi:protein-tyrosine phosphatase
MIRIARALAISLAALAPLAAQAAAPAGAVVERTSAGQLAVSWTSADPVDVLLAERPGARLGEAKLVSPRDVDGHFLATDASAPRSYFILRDARTGEITRVAERLLPLEGGSNFRDIGGYATASGKRVRWGMIYRSGGTPMLTAADLERVKALGLRNMIDLRSSEERVIAPTKIDGVAYTAVGYSMIPLISNVDRGSEGTYRRFPKMLAPHIREIFSKLLRHEGPLAYNCSAGQDRTGFTTAIVLTALGVAPATIEADYHLSTLYRRPENEMPKLSAAMQETSPVAAFFGRYQEDSSLRKPQPLFTAEGTSYLTFALDEVNRKWGSVDGYLAAEAGVSKADLVRLRAAYTE